MPEFSKISELDSYTTPSNNDLVVVVAVSNTGYVTKVTTIEHILSISQGSEFSLSSTPLGDSFVIGNPSEMKEISKTDSVLTALGTMMADIEHIVNYIGSAGGIATLDGNSKVPATQLGGWVELLNTTTNTDTGIKSFDLSAYSSYKDLRFEISALRTGFDGDFGFQVSLDGNTYATSMYSYAPDGGSLLTGQSSVVIAPDFSYGADQYHGAATITLNNRLDANAWCSFNYDVTYWSGASPALTHTKGVGSFNGTGAIKGLKLFFSAGNINSGMHVRILGAT